MLFDENGFLTPVDAIETDLSTFEQYFAQNQHRQALFAHYLQFLEKLKGMDLGSFWQWSDGSFTTRTLQPHDIDIVTFVDFEKYRRFVRAFETLQMTEKQNDLDCYFVAVYPENHRNYALFQSDSAAWFFQFHKTRRSRRTGKQFRKGFIEIKF